MVEGDPGQQIQPQRAYLRCFALVPLGYALGLSYRIAWPMLRMRLREERDVSFGIGTQGQTTSDRLIEQLLDIVPEGRV